MNVAVKHFHKEFELKEFDLSPAVAFQSHSFDFSKLNRAGNLTHSIRAVKCLLVAVWGPGSPFLSGREGVRFQEVWLRVPNYGKCIPPTNHYVPAETAGFEKKYVS